MSEAFWERLADGRYRATGHTVGPWDAALMHGSPPAALLGHVLSSLNPRPGTRLAHLSIDMLGPLQLGDYTIDAEVLRPGKKVELLQAVAKLGDRAVLRASAWRLDTQPGRAPGVRDAEPPPPLPGTPEPQMLFGGTGTTFGYGEALEWRFVEGRFDTPGPATAWARPRLPLLADTPLDGLTRLLLLVDSANGISAELPPSKFTFVPVNLTVSLHRHPESEWVGMSAVSTIDPDGTGLTEARLFDERGHLGRALQTLYVSPR